MFPVTSSVFRSRFKAACATLGLSPLYVPHSLRHGAATRDHFERNISMEDILLRGRWASSKSARRYIQSGPALRMSVRVPPQVAADGAAISPFLYPIFAPQLH